MRFVITFVATAFTTAVLAQERPPASATAYVPLTVDEAHYQALRNYLDQQPFRIALPIVQWLEQLELDAKIEADRKAKVEAAKAEADKAPAASK
jgi:hypothetical protein